MPKIQGDKEGAGTGGNGIVQQYVGGKDGYGVFWGKGSNLHVSQLGWRLQCAMKLREVYLEDMMWWH